MAEPFAPQSLPRGETTVYVTDTPCYLLWEDELKAHKASVRRETLADIMILLTEMRDKANATPILEDADLHLIKSTSVLFLDHLLGKVGRKLEDVNDA